MISSADFGLNQIVCLEHQGTRLYTEVIQIVKSRQVGWVRPLMLVISSDSNLLDLEQCILYDLRQGADLLWPINLFRPALDTEVLPLFTHLQASKSHSDNIQIAHQQLQRFIRQVWQDHAEQFEK